MLTMISGLIVAIRVLDGGKHAGISICCGIVAVDKAKTDANVRKSKAITASRMVADECRDEGYRVVDGVVEDCDRGENRA